MLGSAGKTGAQLAVLFAAACGGSYGSTDMQVAGSYDGHLLVEGTEVSGILDIAQTGTELLATFDAASIGLVAQGSGTIRNDQMELTLSYSFQCPGTAILRGRITAENMRYTGEITASDCTGDVVGTFSFIPRQPR